MSHHKPDHPTPDHPERPILFSGPLVLALLNGAKTETRRVVKRPSKCSAADYDDALRKAARRGWPGAMKTGPEDGLVWAIRCPYGEVGDVLWVREAWATAAMLDKHSPSTIGAMALDAGYSAPGVPVWYAADGAFNVIDTFAAAGPAIWGSRGKGRPSIHMPRWVSRIRLRVVETRIERLQQITAGAAIAEGIDVSDCERDPLKFALERFETLWDGINSKREGASWADDPWVWVVRFKVYTAEGRYFVDAAGHEVAP